MKIVNIVGARPNFMKIAPVIREMEKVSDFETLLIHTGQHYDGEMSDIFFKDLGLPRASKYLDTGSDLQARQTAKIMTKLEDVLIRKKPDLAIVVGDVNSTLAASLVCAKLHIPIAHIEAGLRSFDRKMPEEINRIVTDALSDYLFTTSKEANQNLEREGIPKEKIFFVGNVMIDTLRLLKRKAEHLSTFRLFGLQRKKYALLTLHRPENVDNPDVLKNILMALREVVKLIPIIFPVHPRTRKQIKSFGYQDYFHNSGIKLIKPLGYLAFLNLMINSKFVFTDSGGIQEETTALGIPCLTLRVNTERPVTVSNGTNTIVRDNYKGIIRLARKIMNGSYKKGHRPQLWDGRAAQRIVRILKDKI